MHSAGVDGDGDCPAGAGSIRVRRVAPAPDSLSRDPRARRRDHSVKLAYPPIGTRLPFLFYFLVIVFATWYGDRRTGIFAIVLSALTANYFFRGDPLEASLSAVHVAKTGAFAVEGATLVAIVGLIRKAEARIDADGALERIGGGHHDPEAPLDRDLAKAFETDARVESKHCIALPLRVGSVYFATKARIARVAH